MALTADATDLVSAGAPPVEPYAQTVLALATKNWSVNTWKGEDKYNTGGL